jgi:hypothetical protein
VHLVGFYYKKQDTVWAESEVSLYESVAFWNTICIKCCNNTDVTDFVKALLNDDELTLVIPRSPT